MKKELIRREAIKKRVLYRWSVKRIAQFLFEKYEFKVSLKTLKRWERKADAGWNLRDLSRRPHTIHYKVTLESQNKVVALRRMTGWEAYKLKLQLEKAGFLISESSIKRIIRQSNLSNGSKLLNMRLKWVRWEREHPNSLWQIDHSDEQDKEGTWCVSVEDDCSRYSLALRKTKSVTEEFVINLLKELILIHGKPLEILTDNGSAYGGNGKGDNKFDKWCERNGIKHIRTAVHRPTTTGKVERLFQTIDREISYCFNDLEYFRYRYNFVRPHRSLFGRTPAEVYFNFAKLF